MKNYLKTYRERIKNEKKKKNISWFIVINFKHDYFILQNNSNPNWNWKLLLLKFKMGFLLDSVIWNPVMRLMYRKLILFKIQVES